MNDHASSQPIPTPSSSTQLPVAIIGGGPVGLTAAAHLVDRGLSYVLFESGPDIGHAVAGWRHVRMFSPWQFNIDPVAARLLEETAEETGWTFPDPEHLPTGEELLDGYLRPLASHPAIAPHLRLGTRVVGIGRQRADRLRSADRAGQPFVVHVEGPDGSTRLPVAAVIDASGTWSTPNPAGAGGLPAIGETELNGRIFYGIPDVTGAYRSRYQNRSTIVIGAGHSAIQSILALTEDPDHAPIHWIVRRATTEKAFGGAENDALPARGALGARIRTLVHEGRGDGGRVHVHGPFFVESLVDDGERIAVHGATENGSRMIQAHEVIVATGARPDFSFLRELRLELDPIVEAPKNLAPLIDPNLHSCGTVPPHGERELRHAEEPGVYLVGSKAYGRAPTFLLRTGYEQVRSVVAHLAGDVKAAERVELVLPETGVCSSTPASRGKTEKALPIAACCGGAC